MPKKMPEAIRVKLSKALADDDVATLSAMLASSEGGLDLNFKSIEVPSLMYAAASAGACRCVERLAELGAPINERVANYAGSEVRDRTSLIHALRLGHLNVAQLLLQLGATARLPNETGNTALHTLAAHGLPQTMKSSGQTADTLSTMAAALVGAGCPVDQQNDKGATALMVAIDVKAPIQFVEKLLALGANANLVNTKGESSLHFEIAETHIDLVKLLVRNGGDINGRNRSGRTPLHYAKDVAALDQLVALGADLHSVDNEGRDAFHCIVADPWQKNDAESMLIRLLEHGANPRAPDFADRTALQMLEWEHPEEAPLRATALAAIAASDARKVMRAAAKRHTATVRP